MNNKNPFFVNQSIEILKWYKKGPTKGPTKGPRNLFDKLFLGVDVIFETFA